MRVTRSADPGWRPPSTYRTALRTRTFRLMLAAHGIGTVGQLVLTLAVGLEVLARTGSGGWLSVTVALGFVPYVLASGYAGMLAAATVRSVPDDTLPAANALLTAEHPQPSDLPELRTGPADLGRRPRLHCPRNIRRRQICGNSAPADRSTVIGQPR